ncbi:MAG: dihydroxyacetone kinase subunit DhaL [Lactobacillus amylovorus]|jgi:dihydroxyacetone kinase-like protein|uniref:phosphoenolpyruvate--glycerone phosphotransferase n=3 Tax=Lactobacillus amylovorus TaxID=1604 RepID=A0A9X3W645_LACAM|nr:MULTISPECIES: dihydroxyacetone kinase subunit DhaL [Lactobacillus]ADQ58488.1 dihydroxyacetone kinase [Lactobacillus amylovorus GRL 1112]AEA31443.1 dihydroxyacetone kinase [Lactobacillus amylovorus GRL1118]ATO53518.1 dihydroxyacetone kinase subunit L [Lactobacillus amylovorus DSM 20531]KRK41787.1 dihydroxyacetone kinase [Lactobacillus amylovorus DSM 20531]MCH3996909.1 dihydroxyacetone kinase subunit L [Lactobacillus amylovorus]
MTLTVDTLTTWMSKFAEKVETNKQFLSDLDTPIGDGDHGFNMDRGMKAVEEKLATKPADVTSGFKIIAMALISTVGGASGPLYGTAFLEMAKKSTTTNDIGELLDAALAGIEMRGGAKPGDKTMVDVWNALVPDVKNGILTENRITEAVAATKDMIARKGRASYLGERSKGHVDPGSQSSGYLFEALLETEGLL